MTEQPLVTLPGVEYPGAIRLTMEDGDGPTTIYVRSGENERRREPYATCADAWNDALEKAAQIVERYNAAFPDPECGGAPADIRAMKRAALTEQPQ